jgi:hypothetical protein
MKKILRLLLMLFFLPVFVFLLLLMLPLILLLIAFYTLLAGRKWVNGIKWYTKTAKGVAVKEEFKRQEKSGGLPTNDSVYDVRYDVLMSTPSKDADDKKPLQEGGRPVA